MQGRCAGSGPAARRPDGSREIQGRVQELSGASFNIDYLNENDRRAKSRADASTIGKYNVYYIDEANVALFAKSKWVLPLLDYYPKEYDYADFDPGRRKWPPMTESPISPR